MAGVCVRTLFYLSRGIYCHSSLSTQRKRQCRESKGNVARTRSAIIISNENEIEMFVICGGHCASRTSIYYYFIFIV